MERGKHHISEQLSDFVFLLRLLCQHLKHGLEDGLHFSLKGDIDLGVFLGELQERGFFVVLVVVSGFGFDLEQSVTLFVHAQVLFEGS